MASVKSNGYGSATPKWPIEVLRVKLGVPPDAYQTTGPMLLKCVKLPLKEVLEIGGLDIEFAKRGHGKTAVYWFVIIGNKDIQGLLGDMTGISSEVKRLNVDEIRARVVAALAAAPADVRRRVEKEMGPIPTSDLPLRSYKAELRNYDVEVV